MRIAISCRSILLKSRTGIGRYTYHLIDSLGKIDPYNSYVLYAAKRLFDHKRRLPAFHYQNMKARMDYFNAGPGKADVYHMPFIGNIDRFDGKYIVTVHDLIYKAYPQGHTQATIDLSQSQMEQVIKRADHIICISSSTRRDLHRFFDYPQDQTSVVLNGVDHDIFYPLSDQTETKTFLRSLGVDGDFILSVGTIEVRKNLEGLLRARAILKTDLPVVVAGMQGWMTEKIAPLIKELKLDGKVIFTGYVSDAQLNMLYNTCKVFVFPSFYEGFGFPIVEAFCTGAAVVSSNSSSCAEVASDAALIVDPNEPRSIAAGMEQIISDTKFANALREKALKRAQEFSFVKTAQETLKVYNQVSHAQTLSV